MANLIVSRVCNQDCAYCFTPERFQHARGPEAVASHSFLPVDAFQARLDFLKRSNLDEVRLLGGEPTLHPHFDQLVARAVAAGMRVTVFSNGLMPPAALACLVDLPPGRCRVVVNVNAPTAGQPDGVAARQQEALRRLGARARIGFNIHRTDFDPSLLLDWIAATGCEPVIRLGMAHPSLAGTNSHLQPNEYRAVAARLVSFVTRATRAGVRVGLDCGFVRCMFSPAELSELAAAGADHGWHCDPTLDVDIDDTVFYCFPLAALVTLPFTPAVDAARLHAALREHARPFRQAGVYRECSTCVYLAAQECSGGCLAVAIRRFRRAPFCLVGPEPAASHLSPSAGARAGRQEPSSRALGGPARLAGGRSA